MGELDKGTCVSILDKEFRIACPKDQEDSLKLAAGYLDKQMRQIKRNGRIVGSERIAIMAALNIAHELIAIHQGPDAPVDDLSNRIKLLQNKIDDAIISVQTKSNTVRTEDSSPLQSVMDFGDAKKTTETQQSEIEHASSEAE
tara:strand:+ start:45288 stop:45716 length:429 start_codon:yes stop_codon:yes gene_type:complete